MSPLILSSGALALTILPSLGGRIVALTHGDGPNLLDWAGPDGASQPEDWAAPYRELKGHAFWLGPQSAWWTQQHFAPGHAPHWPPDPWLSYGPQTVVTVTSQRAILEGPVSPVSGVQLRQIIEMADGNRVNITAIITNRRAEPVAWGVWSNTRVPPHAHVFVPVRAAEHVRCEAADPLKAPVWRCEDGWLELIAPATIPAPPSSGKLFITPTRGLIAAFINDHLFLKTARLPVAAVAPRQSPVEIYRALGGTAAEAILELEMHGSYGCLAPKESVMWKEMWSVHACPEAGSTTERIATLNRLANG